MEKGGNVTAGMSIGGQCIAPEGSGSPSPIGARAIRGSVYGVGGAAVTLTLGFTRSVLLARLLLPEHYGVVTLALFYVMLVTQLRSLGFDQALDTAAVTMRSAKYVRRTVSSAPRRCIYTLLDALHLLTLSLLFAVGQPQRAQRAMAVRTVVFIPSVMLGAYLWDIDGVALAADAMAIAGGAMLCWYVREVVDFSLFRLAFWPTLAIAVAWCGGLLVEVTWVGGLWATAVGKAAVFASVYLGVLLAAEREQAVQGIRWVWGQFNRKAAEPIGRV